MVVNDDVYADDAVVVVADGSADATEIAVLDAAMVDRHEPQLYGNVSTCPSIVAVTGRPHG